jgi:hypothetical protein
MNYHSKLLLLLVLFIVYLFLISAIFNHISAWIGLALIVIPMFIPFKKIINKLN